MLHLMFLNKLAHTTFSNKKVKSLCLHHQTLPESMPFTWRGFSGGDPKLSTAGPNWSTQDVNFLLSQDAKPMIR